MKLLKSLLGIFLVLLVGVSLVVLFNQGSSGEGGGLDNLIDLIKPGQDNNDEDDPSDEEVIDPSLLVDDLRDATNVLKIDYGFSGNEVTGFVWKDFNMNNVHLERADGSSEYDGVLTLEEDSMLYTVPKTTNKLGDKIELSHAGLWDYSRFYAYDFTISTSKQYPCGLTFSIMSETASYEEFFGEKLFVMRQNGQDVLYKEFVNAYYENVYTTEYDEAGNPYEVLDRSEAVYEVENVILGSLAPNTDYHFTIIIDDQQRTFDVENPTDLDLIQASYAYVYLNGEFLTTLGYNINEFSQDGQGVDIEYTLGIYFDTKYKTVNAGSNLLMKDLIYAGTKALDYIYEDHADYNLDNYYVADIFRDSNQYISLYQNPDWYYSTVGPIMTDVGSLEPQDIHVLHLTQVEDEYIFTSDTLSGYTSSKVLNLEKSSDSLFRIVNYNGCFNLQVGNYFVYSFDLSISNTLNTAVKMYFGRNAETGNHSPYIYLKPSEDTRFERYNLVITDGAIEKYYGYLLPGEEYKFTFAIKENLETHLYINGRWLTTIDGYVEYSDYQYIDGNGDEQSKIPSFFFNSEDGSNIYDLLEVSNIVLDKWSDETGVNDDRYFEHIWTNPMAYLYYNPDWYFYDLTK